MSVTNLDVIQLRQRQDGALELVHEGEARQVHVHRCFPWRGADRFISLCDGDGVELALIRELAMLDPESRALLDEALRVAGFTLEVQRIHNVVKEIEIRNWTVEVGGEVRTFQTELDEWPRTLEDGRVLISDVAGDLYSIPDLQGLDDKSQRLLWALTD